MIGILALAFACFSLGWALGMLVGQWSGRAQAKQERRYE